MFIEEDLYRDLSQSSYSKYYMLTFDVISPFGPGLLVLMLLLV